MRFEAEQPVLPDLNDTLRAGIETDNQWPFQLLHIRRHCDAWHQRDIACLYAAIGQIDRGRSLGSTRYPYQNDVSFLQTVDVLTVIVQHGVIERIYALEIFCIEHVLCADAMGGFGPEIGMQESQDRAEDGEAGQAKLPTVILEPVRELVVKKRVQNDAGRLLDLGQHSVKLLLSPH